ncbi:S8 family serine peptidase [Gemmatimonadota bacterium]
MRKLLALAVCVGFFAACSDDPAGIVDEQQDEAPSPSYSQVQGDLAGEYVVLLKNNAPPDLGADVQALGGALKYSHEVGIAVVSGLSAKAAEKLGKKKYVAEIQVNAAIEFGPLPNLGLVEFVDALLNSPDDPTTAARWAWQWNMRAIDADQVWAAGRLGSVGVTVAILDTGIDYTYPDLHGLVDLSRSVSFVPEDDELVEALFPGMHPIADLHSHGSNVAAIVASNSYFLAGVTTQTTLMGVKVCSVYGSCLFDRVLAGVLYAADNGADVMNLSLGSYFSKAHARGYGGLINRVFNYARSRGVTAVVSAGNYRGIPGENPDLDHDKNAYKAFCNTPGTLCVSATGPTSADNVYVGPWFEVDAFAPYSYFGRSAINVAAPGGTEAGAVWGPCSRTSLLVPDCQTGYYILGFSGTSQAAPHVSGVAALLVEDLGRRPSQIRARIQQGADDLGQRGTDPFYGKGRLNAAGALRIH